MGRTRRGVVVIALGFLAAACGGDGLDQSAIRLGETTTAPSTTAAPSIDLSPPTRAAVEEVPADEPAVGPIRIDQFGYRPGDPKVAVLVDPEVGFDADLDYEPGPSIQVIRIEDGEEDGEVVLEGAPEPWAEGRVSDQSGDRGWWFDFAAVTEPGTYRIVDPGTGQTSGPFDIGDDVYDEVLDAALRMFWFNRANADHPPDLAGPWADGPAYVGDDQDPGARSVDARDDPSTARDLSGGWFDAGDTNKYVTFALEPVHGLLTAYRNHPDVFHDGVGIPESGNGIPDVIDEVRWEIDWLERMQLDDGGVLTKVGLIDVENRLTPSEATRPRYYEEACSSATIAAAGMFAHAALVFGRMPDLAGDAERLAERAESAWNWYQDNPKRDDCDPQIVRAGDADLSIEEQADAEVTAAIYLFALTGAGRYHQIVVDGYRDTLPFTGTGFGDYGPDQADALLFYRSIRGADQTVVTDISRRVAELVSTSPLFGRESDRDLYRSYLADVNYHWGSNMVKANVGRANLAVGPVAGGRERALGHLHYLHGVNPFGVVYLTNMDHLGAERSAQHLFHFWFGEKTAYDVGRGSEVGVAPGYLVGGPNRAYGGGASPPAQQPPLKSYRDWSAYGSEPSWEVTEPAIYYQSAYVALLAAILDSDA